MTVVAMDVSAEPVNGVDEQLVRQLVDRARAEGLKLTGEGGLLARLTKVVVESALEGDMDDHLGYGKHDPAGRNGGNSRNGTRSKTLVTEAGPVEITVPRDRESSCEPKIVAKRQRLLSGIDDLVVSRMATATDHRAVEDPPPGSTCTVDLARVDGDLACVASRNTTGARAVLSIACPPSPEGL